MICTICKVGKTKTGTATVSLQRGKTTIIIKEVPAEVCDNCGEYYLSDRIAEQLFVQANEAVKRQAEVEIVKYAAA